ncbi:hypothetical protein JW796_02730 [Candidatus Dojkabacteria bacterium]|nr:hypothetical protein [Candidatus Dojkabacteria bacterium]
MRNGNGYYFFYRGAFHDAYDRYIEAQVVTMDTSSPITQEEMLHAGEEILRENVLDLETVEPHLDRAAILAVHSSIVLDSILTMAAVEMGEEEYLYWHDRAKEQTVKDALEISAKKRESLTLMGKKVNERFIYPFITREYLEIILNNFQEMYIDLMFCGNMNREKTRVSEDMASMLELVLLSYGEEHRGLLQQLLHIEDEVNGKIVNVADQAIEFGKRLLQYAKGTALEVAIVRHHKPLTRPLKELSLDYKIGDLCAVSDIDKLSNLGLPAMLTLRDLKRIGSL